MNAYRIFALAAMALAGATAVASADTVELTLTVPMKITLSGGSSPAKGPGGTLKPFDVNCVVGSALGYATGVGAQGTIVGQGSTATSGSKTIQRADGSMSTSPSATVIITYDDGFNNAGRSASRPPDSYLCWVAWQTPNPSLPPLFVQGALTAGR